MPSTPIIPQDLRRDYSAFSDESSNDGKHRFMVIGGILCRSYEAHAIAERFAVIQRRYLYQESLHWKNVSRRKLEIYKAWIDEALYLIQERKMDFSCIVFERSKVDHRRYNENDPETGFFKFLYQHHLKHVRRYKPPSTLRCFHGNMDTRYDLAVLKRCLNGGTPKRGLTIFHPYRQVEFKQVNRTRCLQISDILIGGVAHWWNGKDASMAGTPKAELADYLRVNAPVHTLREKTTWPDWGFSIWEFGL